MNFHARVERLAICSVLLNETVANDLFTHIRSTFLSLHATIMNVWQRMIDEVQARCRDFFLIVNNQSVGRRETITKAKVTLINSLI
jgi:hypothetical protein